METDGDCNASRDNLFMEQRPASPSFAHTPSLPILPLHNVHNPISCSPPKLSPTQLHLPCLINLQRNRLKNQSRTSASSGQQSISAAGARCSAAAPMSRNDYLGRAIVKRLTPESRCRKIPAQISVPLATGCGYLRGYIRPVPNRAESKGLRGKT